MAAAFGSLIAGRVPLVSRERYTEPYRGCKGAIKEQFHVRVEGRLALPETPARERECLSRASEARGCLSRAPLAVFLGLVRYVFSLAGGYSVRVEGRPVS